MEQKFNVGDKVLIARKHSSWNHEGMMDHWLGEIMTIGGYGGGNYYYMEEDQEEWDGHGWSWHAECLEPADEYEQVEFKESDILSLLEVM